MSCVHTAAPVKSKLVRALMRAIVLVLALMAVSSAVAGCEKEPSVAGAGPVATVAIYADSPGYPDLAALVETADAVIIGVVTAAESREIGGLPYLVSAVTVERTVKGDLEAGDAIEVKQLLSADSPQRIWLYREGMRVLLFLVEFPGLPYSPLSPIQGVVSIEGGKTRAAPGNSLFPTPRAEKELLFELDALVD